MDVERGHFKTCFVILHLKAGSGTPVLFGPVLDNGRFENIKRL
jgi:hypothetical protein